MQATLAASTIRTRVKYVRGALRAAVHDRLLSEDPTAGLKLAAVRKTEHTMRIPSPREVNAIREHAEPFLRPTLDVMAYAGLRIGEAAAVQVSDVDWMRRTVHVARQVQNRPGTREICPPKHGSERVVPVPSALTERLSAAMHDVGVFGSAQWFLPGDPPSPNALRRWFEKACTAAGWTGSRRTTSGTSTSRA